MTDSIYSLIPLSDLKTILSIDDREHTLSLFCLTTAAYAIGQYCHRRLLRKKRPDFFSFKGRRRMNRIYAGQSALRIILRTFSDLEGIIAAFIKYRKPDGVSGSFSAGVADIERGIIFHECIEGEIDMPEWRVVRAFITFADGRTASGEAAKVYIWNEGGG
jgi:hypothetical protein